MRVHVESIAHLLGLRNVIWDAESKSDVLQGRVVRLLGEEIGDELRIACCACLMQL